MSLAEVLQIHWPAYCAQFGPLLPDEQVAAVRAIRRCRTPALGGQLYQCDCGRRHFAWHSCNHRACPRCGRADAQAWLEQQRTRLLPVPYFLVTLTVPEPLREPIRAAPRAWLSALLKEGASAVQDLARQPQHLGAELGLTAVVQTWTRDLRYHPHVHLLVPGGGLTADGLRWLRVKDPQFFLPQVKLAARFKGRLLAWLREPAQAELLAAVPVKAWRQKWVADVQPVGSGEAALKYLAAYLCRPPLHECQIESCDAAQVTFRYRENGGAVQRVTVSGAEFVRRVLQHVLPKGFQRVRHYGWLGAAASARRARIAALLDWRAPAALPVPAIPPPKCPACGKVMTLLGEVPRGPPPPDTS
ncbi:MAG TPA: transposase, partial [Burkholderiaceae bacterium]|nr:transposase [Burkholderiaceae bacterium]